MYRQNEEINTLQLQRQILIRTYDRNEITAEEYNSQVLILDNKINVLKSDILKIADEKIKIIKEESEQRRIKMVDEKAKVVREKKEKKVVGPKKESYASIILEVLQLKTIKNIDVAADKVLERLPGRAKASVKSQISVMINEVKKGKKPKYTWDEATFQLTEL